MKLELIGEGLARVTFEDGSSLTTNMRIAGETLEGYGYKRAIRGFAGAMSRNWYNVQTNNGENTNSIISEDSKEQKGFRGYGNLLE